MGPTTFPLLDDPEEANSSTPLIRPRSKGGNESPLVALWLDDEPSSELLDEVARRLQWTSALVALAFLIANALILTAHVAGWTTLPRPVVHALIGAVATVVSTAIFFTARARKLPLSQLISAGLAYEVIIALAISMGDHLGPLTGDRPLESISWLAVWIVVFPVVVPTDPRKTLVAAFLAASTWPVAFGISLALGNESPPTPIVLMNFLENYLAAVVALGPMLVVRRLGAQVERARRMGSYQLVERLAGGGMGEIWRARHRMLARPVAIKLIRPEALDVRSRTELLVRRFEREAQATAVLQSPHTVALYDFGLTKDGVFYYVMELLEGLDLDALVRRFGPLPAERAVFMLLQACDSLREAHEAGLIHRDIKPANLYACRRGRYHDYVKVLDFGLVKASWSTGEEEAPLTEEGVASGTPAFMAPEAAAGDQLDARVDIYSLGCVAYWLVTGQRVFTGSTPLQIALQHVQKVPESPSQRTGTSISDDLEELIMACLEKAPGDRPASVAEVARDLEYCRASGSWDNEHASDWWRQNLPPGTY